MRLSLSQSALSIYKHCQYAYKLRYISRCSPVFYDPSILEVGSFVHDAIDGYYRHHYLMHGTADDILAESYAELKKSWDISFLPAQLKQAYTCLQNHSEWEYDNITNGIGTKPLTEQKIGQMGYYGIIDYIDLPNLKVIDWKTGRNPYVTYGYRMQAHIYRILFEAQFNMKLKNFHFYFLFPNEFRTISYEKEKQIKVGKEVEKLKAEVIHSRDIGEFEKNPRTAKGCRNCNFAYYCMRGV